MAAADGEVDGAAVAVVDGGDLLGHLRHMTINHPGITKVSHGDLDFGLGH